MEFTKLTWKNDQTPALDEDNLNRIEDAIDDLVNRTNRFCQISSVDGGSTCTIINNGMTIINENNSQVSGTSSVGFCQVKVPDGIKYVKVTLCIYDSGASSIRVHVNQQTAAGKGDIGKTVAWATDCPRSGYFPASASNSVVVDCSQGKYFDVKIDEGELDPDIITLIVEEMRNSSVY